MTKLKEIRLHKLMTQEELADKSGISRQTIIALEKDDNKICSSLTLVKLANALEVKADDLLFLPKV